MRPWQSLSFIHLQQPLQPTPTPYRHLCGGNSAPEPVIPEIRLKKPYIRQEETALPPSPPVRHNSTRNVVQYYLFIVLSGEPGMSNARAREPRYGAPFLRRCPNIMPHVDKSRKSGPQTRPRPLSLRYLSCGRARWTGRARYVNFTIVCVGRLQLPAQATTSLIHPLFSYAPPRPPSLSPYAICKSFP